MDIEKLYKKFLEHPQITTDSRIVTNNGLFFALKGENFDGNKFAQKAIDNGCAFAIIDNPKYASGPKFIVVENVLKTLQKLAVYHRKEMNIPVIGITGSNGKTTTKELLALVLKKKYKVSYTQGNLNNHIGVPLTLLSFNHETELGIVEMGANHPGEIKALSELAKPDYGLITNIGRAHLEGFGTFDNIIKTKSELFNYIAKNNGKVFYNANDELLKELVFDAKLNAISYGNKENSSVYGYVEKPDLNLKLKVFIANNGYKINTNLIGDYNLSNILAAAAIGHYFSISDPLIIDAIEKYNPTNNRSQLLKTPFNQLFLDAYNANPTSVKAAINNFERLTLPNKCLVLGDMFELGDLAVQDHYEIIRYIDKRDYNKIILVGDIFSGLEVNAEILQFKNVDLLQKWLNKNPIKESNILIKGSRGNQLERIVEYL
ncbi:MAG: UDP-N-acetylmuramoyl-tripeptide--D-alanyl-D-alanine ligase [Bacteroidota bacterium]